MKPERSRDEHSGRRREGDGNVREGRRYFENVDLDEADLWQQKV